MHKWQQTSHIRVYVYRLYKITLNIKKKKIELKKKIFIIIIQVVFVYFSPSVFQSNAHVPRRHRDLYYIRLHIRLQIIRETKTTIGTGLQTEQKKS